MPIFSSKATLENVMIQNNIIHFKVFSENMEMQQSVDNPNTVTPQETYKQLEQYLDSLQGNYVCINLYSRSYKTENETGEVLKKQMNKNNVFKHFFKLGETQQINTSLSNNFGGGFGIQDIISLNNQMQEMRFQFQQQEAERRIKELERDLKQATTNKKSYLETIAEQMAKSMASEYLNKNTPALSETPVKTTIADQPTESNDKTKEIAKKGSNAVMRLVKIGGTDVIEGLEDIADLLESNPAKAVEILQQIKEANNVQ